MKDAGLKAETSAPRQTRQRKTAPQKLSVRAQIEHQLIEALLQNPTLIPYVKSRFDSQDFTEPRYIKIAQLLWQAETDDAAVDIQNIINNCSDENLNAFISGVLLRKTPPPNLQARVDGCLKKLRAFLMRDLEQRVRSSARAEGADEIQTLEQLVKLSNERRALSNHDAEDAPNENINDERS